MRRARLVAALRGEVTLGNPGPRAMAGGRKLVIRLIGSVERRLGLVEAFLLEQRTTQHELRVPGLVEEVDSVSEQLERVPRLLLGTHHVTGPQMHLGEG